MPFSRTAKLITTIVLGLSLCVIIVWENAAGIFAPKLYNDRPDCPFCYYLYCRALLSYRVARRETLDAWIIAMLGILTAAGIYLCVPVSLPGKIMTVAGLLYAVPLLLAAVARVPLQHYAACSDSCLSQRNWRWPQPAAS